MKLPKLTLVIKFLGRELILIFRKKQRGAGRKPGLSPEAGSGITPFVLKYST